MRFTEAVIRHMIAQNNHKLKIALPAVVVGVEKLSDGFIDVKPLVNFMNPLTDETVEYPTISDVRVIFPSNSTSTICFPVNQGDFVDLVFQSSDVQKFVNGNTEQHDPIMLSFGNLSNVVAFVGFSPFQDSCFNSNNYQNDFNLSDLNIVHNKNTDREAIVSISDEGDIALKSPTKVVVESPSVNVQAGEINVNNARISTNNDIFIQGQSVNRFMKTHTHIDSQGVPTSTPVGF